jgi:hypothetical protein
MAKKPSKKLSQGKKMGNVKTLSEITIKKPIDPTSPY